MPVGRRRNRAPPEPCWKVELPFFADSIQAGALIATGQSTNQASAHEDLGAFLEFVATLEPPDRVLAQCRRCRIRIRGM